MVAYSFRIFGINLGNIYGAIVGITPNLVSPNICFWADLAKSKTSFISIFIYLALSAIFSPKGVKKTFLFVLSTNLTFNNFSNSCIPELRVDSLTKHSLAALPKCKHFETDTKYFKHALFWKFRFSINCKAL